MTPSFFKYVFIYKSLPDRWSFPFRRKTIYLPESHGRVHETHIKTPIEEAEHFPYDESDSYSGQPQQRYHQQANNNVNHARYWRKKKIQFQEAL